MIRNIFFALILIYAGLGGNLQMSSRGLSIETAALAVEAMPDPGCDGLGSPMADTGASISGGNCVFSNVKAMKGLMWMNAPLVEGGHRYKVVVVMPSYTQGIGRFMIGLDMTQTATIPPLLAVDLNGLAPIEGRGTLPQGTEPAAAPGDMGADPMGAFRMECFEGIHGPIDPEVKPGLKGSSHSHGFVGGTYVRPNSTYASLRNHGGTTCGTEQTYPVNTSLYWQPDMYDGAGHIVQPFVHQIYYKREPASSPGCTFGDTYYKGICIGLPNAIRFIMGYNSATGTGGPLDDITGGPAIIKYGCASPDQLPYDIDPVTPGVQSQSNKMSDLFGGACPLGYIVNVQASAQNCWDGVNLDSPDHRSHVAIPSVFNGTVARCDSGHPYYFPDFQWSSFWKVDANFVAGKWHLASDEMAVGAMVTANRGKTLHVDYFEAWKPSAKAQWLANCIDAHKSCSAGSLGNLTKIKGDQGWPPVPANNLYLPVMDYGMGPDMTAPGTWTFEVTAAASGTIMIAGIEDGAGNGFTGSISSISVQEITAGRKGPATVTVH